MLKRLRPATGWPLWVQITSLTLFLLVLGGVLLTPLEYYAKVVLLIGLWTWMWLPRPPLEMLQACFSRQKVLFFFPPILAMAAAAKAKVAHGKDQKPRVALTIDDAPVGMYDTQPAENCCTSKILKLLNKFQAKATWFIIGSQVQGDRKSLVEEMVKSGHELGNHGMVDRAAWSLGREEFAKDVETTQKIIEGLGSGTRQWFRPGQALFTPWKLQWLCDHGYRLAIASVYPHDAMDLPPYQCSWSWLIAWHLITKIQPGDVIVIHDRPWNVRALEIALPHLTAHFTLCTLSELADACDELTLLKDKLGQDHLVTESDESKPALRARSRKNFRDKGAS